MKRLIRILFISIFILVVSASTVSAYSWDVNLLGSGAFSDTLAVDSSNNYLLAYRKAADTSKTYFTKSAQVSQGWSTPLTINHTCINPAIIAKSTSVYLIVCEQSAEYSQGLMGLLSTNSGASFSPIAIDATATMKNASLALSDSGSILISYFDETNSNLKFAISSDGSTWVTSNVDDDGEVAEYTSIANAGGNTFLILYQDKYSVIKLAKTTNSGTSWATSSVDSSGDLAFEGRQNITTDSLGNYLITYADYSEDVDLGFGKSTNGGTTWDLDIIDQPGSEATEVGDVGSITVDSNNNYMIIYSDSTSRTILSAYSSNQGANWTLEAASGSDEASSLSLTTDTFDNFVYSYTIPGNFLFVAITYTDYGSLRVVMNQVTPDPTENTTPSITGAVIDLTTSIVGVNYQVDGTAGDWSSCTADDGVFDTYNEDFFCQLDDALSVGEHTVYVQAVGNGRPLRVSETKSYGSDTFLVITPTSTADSSTSNSTNPGPAYAPSCVSARPSSAPNLFQINTSATSATIFFTPISNTPTYYVSYSTKPIAEDHGQLVTLSTEGVQSITVDHLQPNTHYYFKVRGQIDCMPGDWSSTLKAKTSWLGGKSMRISYPFSQYSSAPSVPSANLSKSEKIEASPEVLPPAMPTNPPTPENSDTFLPSPSPNQRQCVKLLWWCI